MIGAVAYSCCAPAFAAFGVAVVNTLHVAAPSVVLPRECVSWCGFRVNESMIVAEGLERIIFSGLVCVSLKLVWKVGPAGIFLLEHQTRSLLLAAILPPVKAHLVGFPALSLKYHPASVTGDPVVL